MMMYAIAAIGGTIGAVWLWLRREAGMTPDKEEGVEVFTSGGAYAYTETLTYRDGQLIPKGVMGDRDRYYSVNPNFRRAVRHLNLVSKKRGGIQISWTSPHVLTLLPDFTTDDGSWNLPGYDSSGNYIGGGYDRSGTAIKYSDL
jgi:hypothetical protein